MKVAILQLGVNDEESKSARLARVGTLIDKVSDADLILLPEIWNIGYFSFARYAVESETLEGQTLSFLSAKAKQHKLHIFTGSFVERAGDKLYNTCALLSSTGDICGHYRKIHLFGIGSDERKILSAGDKIVVVNTEFGRVGLSICYDLRFPELFRCMAAQGAEIMLTCAAWPYPRVENWLVLNRARAIENQCYFLSCGCAGGGSGKGFIGRSQVVDPWGNIVASAGEKETILMAEIDSAAVGAARAELSFLRDRVLA